MEGKSLAIQDWRLFFDVQGVIAETLTLGVESGWRVERALSTTLTHWYTIAYKPLVESGE